MNTEELNKVAEIIGNLGQDATHGLTMYLGVDFATSVLGYGMGAIVCFTIYKIAVRIITAISGCQLASKYMADLRDALKIGSSGWLSDGEARQTFEKLKELISAR